MFTLVPQPAQVTSFSFSTQQLRVLTIDSSPWFVGKDVAVMLGYTNHNKALRDHCRGVTKRYPIVDSLGRQQEVRISSESDLYRLIAHSRLPAAEQFERWIFEEVIPSIRRTGAYRHRPAEPCSANRHEIRQLRGPEFSVLQYDQRRVRIAHREDGIWVSACDAFAAMGFSTATSHLSKKLPHGEAQTIEVGSETAISGRLIVLNGTALQRIARRSPKPTVRPFTNWLNSAVEATGLRLATSGYQLPLLEAEQKPRNRIEQFQAEQRRQLVGRAQVAKALIRQIELANEESIEATGEEDVPRVANILFESILGTQDLQGLTLGLADYLCRAIGGTTVSADEWEVLDGMMGSLRHDRGQGRTLPNLR